MDLIKRTHHNNRCYKCKKEITGIGRIDSKGEFVFCIKCFNCAECKEAFPSEVTTIKWNYSQLGPGEPPSEPRFPLHQRCWEKIRVEVRCDHCSKPIWLPKGERPYHSGMIWHPSCIVCNYNACQKRLNILDGRELDLLDPSTAAVGPQGTPDIPVLGRKKRWYSNFILSRLLHTASLLLRVIRGKNNGL